MHLDVGEPNGAARAVAVLLHPHPDYGGDRFHPFVAGLHRRLPPTGVAAVRFDFGSGDLEHARAEALTAIDECAERWPGRTGLLIGYSFGAGIAARVDDERVGGWFLLAPPATALAESPIGADSRPKAIAVPEHDQGSPPHAIDRAVDGWTATSVTVVPGCDHFLGGAVDHVTDLALDWIAATVAG